MIEITLDDVYKVFARYKSDKNFRLYFASKNRGIIDILKDITFYQWCEIYKNRYNYKIV